MRNEMTRQTSATGADVSEAAVRLANHRHPPVILRRPPVRITGLNNSIHLLIKTLRITVCHAAHIVSHEEQAEIQFLRFALTL